MPVLDRSSLVHPTAPPADARGARSVLVALLGLALALSVLLARPTVVAAQTAGPSSTAGAQTASTTITTTDDLLVGSTTSTTAAPPTTVNPAGSNKRAQSVADADTRRVWYIVAALLAVAFLLLVLTIAYWRHTRPGRGPVTGGRSRAAPDTPAGPDRAKDSAGASSDDAKAAEGSADEPAPSKRSSRRNRPHGKHSAERK